MVQAVARQVQADRGWVSFGTGCWGVLGEGHSGLRGIREGGLPGKHHHFGGVAWRVRPSPAW